MTVLEKVKRSIMDRIDSGEYPVGAKLPPLRDLSEEFKASFMTVQRAVRALQDERKVESYVGKGTFVSGGTIGGAEKAASAGSVLFVFSEPSLEDVKNYQLDVYCGVQARCQELGIREQAMMPYDSADTLDLSSLRGAICVDSSGPVGRLLKAGVPAVSCGIIPDDQRIDSATPNYFDGARLVAGHLADRGAEKVFFVNSVKGDTLTFAERRLGYLAALKERGLKPMPEETWFRRRKEDGVKRVLAAAAKGGRRSAIFAANDAMAMEILELAAEMGVKVPKDVMVAGLEDMACGRSCQPPLTTAGYDKKGLGKDAVDLLLRSSARKASNGGAERIMTPMSLIVRESSGKAR